MRVTRIAVQPLFLGIMLLLPVFSVAQDAPRLDENPQRAPVPAEESLLQESDIVLPEELLQVEEATPEELDAELPDLSDPVMAALDTPLPQPGALVVPRELFALPSPGEEGAVTTAATPGSLYSNGLFGAGSMSYIIGSISLYRVGATPGFQFDFSHEARDGYNFEEPGNGFFDRDDQIGVAVSGRGDSFGGEVEGRFVERETGLQGLSTFYSTTSRRVDGSALVDFQVSPIATLMAGADIGTAQRIYNSDGGSTSPRDTELLFSPQAGLTISTETTDTTISAGYRFRSVDGSDDGIDDTSDLLQTLRGSIAAETSYWTNLVIFADVGVAWRIGSPAVMPFSLGATAILSDALTLDVSGGFEAVDRSYADIWGLLPFLAFTDEDGDLLLRQDAWFADAGVTLAVFDQAAALEVGARGEHRYQSIDLSRYDPAVGRYRFETNTQTRLIPRGALLLEGPWWRSRFFWDAYLGNRSVIEPVQSLGMDAGVFNATESLRGTATFAYELYDTSFDGGTAPELDLAGFVSVTDSIEISAEVRDILSLFLDDGRPAVGDTVEEDFPFVEPGFLFAVLTRISL